MSLQRPLAADPVLSQLPARTPLGRGGLGADPAASGAELPPAQVRGGDATADVLPPV